MGRTRRAMRLLVVNSLAAGYAVPKSVRGWLYRRCGFEVGDHTTLFSGTIVRTTNLSIGPECFVNHRCLFDHGDITIGRAVYLSSGVTLASGDHEPGTTAQRAGAPVSRPIVIEDGSWLGAGVVVLGGVRIRRGCVVGAGAAVTRDTEPDGVYAGVPARRIRDLS